MAAVGAPWKGQLAKSGIPLCDIECQAAKGSAQQVAGMSMPLSCVDIPAS